MLLVKTEIKPSPIHGVGLFAGEFIPKGTIIWRFLTGFDLKILEKDFYEFPKIVQDYVWDRSWWSRDKKHFIMSSDNDKFTNHSLNNNVTGIDTNEEEWIAVALQDIHVGEELTTNYEEL